MRPNKKYCWNTMYQLEEGCSASPLMSAKESPEVSWEENDVEALTGDREVLGSEDPASDMEADEDDSEAKSEVGDTEQGVKPKSLKYG